MSSGHLTISKLLCVKQYEIHRNSLLLYLLLRGHILGGHLFIHAQDDPRLHFDMGSLVDSV